MNFREVWYKGHLLKFVINNPLIKSPPLINLLSLAASVSSKARIMTSSFFCLICFKLLYSLLQWKPLY